MSDRKNQPKIVVFVGQEKEPMEMDFEYALELYESLDKVFGSTKREVEVLPHESQMKH